MIAAVNLNPSTDIITPVNNFMPGKVLRSENISSYPGGKAANTARALAVLGASPVVCGYCGAADLAGMKTFLTKYGVRADLISVHGTNRLCLIIASGKKETVINGESRLKISAKHRKALINKIRGLSMRAGIFIFSGSLPLSLPESFYASCIRSVKNSAKTILDTHSGYLREGIKAGPDILKVNMHELGSAFGRKLDRRGKKSRDFIRSLAVRHGIKTIIATLGPGGSLLYDKGAFKLIRAYKVKSAVSSVGCGDAYSAGLAYALEKGLKMADACLLGAACASANLEAPAACFIDKKSIRKFYR